MPQPFKRRGRTVYIAASAVIRRPALALGIANIIAHWSMLEHTMSLMYTYLLLGEEKSAFELYHNLIDMGMRQTAFMSAAKGKLSKELISEVQLLNTDVRKLAKRRNTVAHGTWAMIESKPESLLLCDVRAMNSKINQVFDMLRKVAREKITTPQSVDITPDEFIQYKHRDFQAIVTDIIAMDARANETAKKVLARTLELAKERGGL